MGPVVSDAEIKAAAARLRGVIVATPLVPFPAAGPLMIKPESLQPTGAFKLRGAYNGDQRAVRGAAAARRGGPLQRQPRARRGLRGPAARRPGRRSWSPDTAPAIKTDAIIATGPSLSPSRRPWPPGWPAARPADRHGYALIPPFEDREVIAGQGTIGLEIMASQPGHRPRSWSRSAGRPDLRRRGRGPVGQPGRHRGRSGAGSGRRRAGTHCARGAGRLARRPSAHGGRRASGGAGRDLPFAHMREFVAGIVTVTDEQLLAAVPPGLGARLVAEPGGAVAVAAWLVPPGRLPAARRPVRGTVRRQHRAGLAGPGHCWVGHTRAS